MKKIEILKLAVIIIFFYKLKVVDFITHISHKSVVSVINYMITFRQVRGERRYSGRALKNQTTRLRAKKRGLLFFIDFLVVNLCSLYRRLRGRRIYLGARMMNDNLAARMKNDVSRCDDEERRISARG